MEKVWASPDFVLTMRLGTIEEHALLLASMFRGVKYETEEDLPKEEDMPFRSKKSKIQDQDSSIEDRVFVCLGRSREHGGKSHAWVMTLSKAFDQVTFWEPTSAT